MEYKKIGNTHGENDTIFNTFARGLCYYIDRFINELVTTVELPYLRRAETTKIVTESK